MLWPIWPTTVLVHSCSWTLTYNSFLLCSNDVLSLLLVTQ